MQKWMRQGLEELHEFFRQLELSGDLQAHEGPVAGGDVGE